MEDDTFFERADAHIHLSNQQISEDVTRGKVSASMMYSTARFNAWLSACGFDNGDEMRENKQEVIDYFVAEYRKMLEENLNDYIENYQPYMQATS
jgi:hypothetical protein